MIEPINTKPAPVVRKITEITVPITGFVPNEKLYAFDFDLDYLNKNASEQKRLGLFTGAYATNSRERIYKASVYKEMQRINAQEPSKDHGDDEDSQPLFVSMLDIGLDIVEKKAFYNSVSIDQAMETGAMRFDRVRFHDARYLLELIKTWMQDTYGEHAVENIDFSNLTTLTSEYPQCIPWLFEVFPALHTLVHNVYVAHYPHPITVITARIDKVKVVSCSLRTRPDVEVVWAASPDKR